MLDISTLLEEIKAAPYVESSIRTPHCGVVQFNEELQPGSKLVGPHGNWREKPGTVLATIDRERCMKNVNALEKGELVSINAGLSGQFVEAGTEIMRVRHFLSREEVLQIILKQALYLFNAPEKAKYYFVPAVDVKVKNTGPKSVSVHDGMELFIISRMKREMPLRYSGPDGVIYAVYFSVNQNLDPGMPLIGVCPPSQVGQIEEVSMRVQTEWPED
ncbi:biotin attachment protein [Desulfovibrio sp. OttesenSCG-928-C06]|nr:biotin attachment protein [Desulfovibrio sp. OttesenSCG-928-C06]